MISIGEIMGTFQRVCSQDSRYIGMIFREPGGKKIEFGNIRIIGPGDDPERPMAIAKDIGQECVAVIEFDKKESVWLAARSNRMQIIERICGKIGETSFRLAWS